MKLFTRSEWENLWEQLDKAMKEKSLGEFSSFCNKIKSEWQEKYPGVDFSNARYAAHVENWLEKNSEAIPAKVILSLSKDDIKYDWFFFKHLAPLLGYKLANHG